MRHEEPVRITRKDPALGVSKNPIHTRRNVEDLGDPYIETAQLDDHTTCRSCGQVYMSGRWYLKDEIPHNGVKVAQKNALTTCPACRKSQDHVPGGVLTLSGGFVWEHEEEIMNLIRNEAIKAQSVNALERVMSLDSSDGKMEITTTNEKLAQRIGKALHKAYDGRIDYKWSEDTKLARVKWHRDA